MKEATTGDVLRVFWKHARRHKGRAFLILLFIAIATTLDALQPWVLKQLFDQLEQQSPSTATIGMFMMPLGMLLGIKVGGWTCWRTMAVMNNRFQPAVMSSLQESSFAYLLGHSYRFFADTFAGSLGKKVFRLARAFETFADEIEFRILPIVIVLSVSVVGLYFQYPLMAVLFIVWTCLFLFFNYLAARWAVVADINRSKIDSELGGALADAVTNAVTIKLFPAAEYENKKFQEIAQRFARAQTRSWDRHEVIFAVQGALMIAIEIGLMYIAVDFWIKGRLTLGDVAFVQTSLIVVFSKLWEIGRTFRHIFDSFADGKEMVEILKEPHEIRDRKGAKALRVRRGQIEFRRVDFFFDKRPILEDFSLAITPRQKVALVGPSGAGKSTITRLLFRFYDVKDGTVLVDGQDIGKATQDSLRENISLVPQEPILFHRTLMENIRYGRMDATDDEVKEAARRAHCHEFIANLSEGYETYVGERGVKLSGGERQRVAIARAILKNAPILVLDEATSSLDSESESLIQDALRELMRDKTVIVIAHRLSTIMEMDRIVVIEDGRVAADGTHDQLLRQKGTYHKLWNIQAGGFVD